MRALGMHWRTCLIGSCLFALVSCGGLSNEPSVPKFDGVYWVSASNKTTELRPFSGERQYVKGKKCIKLNDEIPVVSKKEFSGFLARNVSHGENVWRRTRRTIDGDTSFFCPADKVDPKIVSKPEYTFLMLTDISPGVLYELNERVFIGEYKSWYVYVRE